jgi:hypothetical protein
LDLKRPLARLCHERNSSSEVLIPFDSRKPEANSFEDTLIWRRRVPNPIAGDISLSQSPNDNISTLNSSHGARCT